MLRPAMTPATNGLIAIPTSDALVRTPNPVPWAAAGMTVPAALYDAVIAAPMPTPNNADAVVMTHRFVEAPITTAATAAAAVPPTMTTRGEWTRINLPQK